MTCSKTKHKEKQTWGVGNILCKTPHQSVASKTRHREKSLLLYRYRKVRGVSVRQEKRNKKHDIATHTIKKTLLLYSKTITNDQSYAHNKLCSFWFCTKKKQANLRVQYLILCGVLGPGTAAEKQTCRSNN